MGKHELSNVVEVKLGLVEMSKWWKVTVVKIWNMYLNFWNDQDGGLIGIMTCECLKPGNMNFWNMKLEKLKFEILKSAYWMVANMQPVAAVVWFGLWPETAGHWPAVKGQLDERMLWKRQQLDAGRQLLNKMCESCEGQDRQSFKLLGKVQGFQILSKVLIYVEGVKEYDDRKNCPYCKK